MISVPIFLLVSTNALSYKGAWQVLTPYGPTERSHASLECIEGSVFVHGGVVNRSVLSDPDYMGVSCEDIIMGPNLSWWPHAEAVRRLPAGKGSV